MKILRILLLLPLVIAPTCAFAAAVDNGGNTATFVNTAPAQAPALTATVRAAGLAAAVSAPDGIGALSTRSGILVWEARGDSGREIDEKRAARLEAYVRNGGSLLLTLSRNAGDGPFRLAPMLPTAAWKTRITDREKTDGALSLAETDAAWPGGAAAKPDGFTVPYWYEIRPVAAVERGQERYDRFERPIPYLATTRSAAPKQPAGTEFWTHSLLSREWRIRARGADVGASPLLITGRYGAGRIAVFASTAELPDGAAARAFWAPVVRWLAEGRLAGTRGASPLAALPAPTTRVDVTARKLLVTLHGPAGGTALPVHLIGRVLTWEHTYVADTEADATLPAGGAAVTVPLPLPAAPGPTGYQALSYRDAYTVRLGILSANGADILSETRAAADLRPAVTVSVATDPGRGRDYPFHAPPPFESESMAFHPLGLPLSAYGYTPGATAHVTVTVANGPRNIAPLATAADEVDPKNESVMALNDEGSQAEKRPVRSEVIGWGVWSGKASVENRLTFTFPHPVTVTAVTLLGADTDYRGHLRHNPAAVAVEADGREVARDTDIGPRFPAEQGRVRVPLSAPVTATVIRLRFPASRDGVVLGDVGIEGWDAASGSAPAAGPATGTLSLSLTDALTGKTTPLKSQSVTLAPGAQQTLSVPVTLPTGADVRLLRLVGEWTPSAGGAAAGAMGDAPLLVLSPKRPMQPISDITGANTISLGYIVTRGFRNVFDTGVGTAEIGEGWGQPDDLVWAFARGLKQLSPRAHTEAGRLYVSESDMRHYSTPWRTFFDGEEFYNVAAPLLVDRFKRDRNWATAKTVQLAHSDRWDSGPDMSAVYSWQDFEAFDAYLRANGLPGLAGKTREELSQEVDTKYAGRWQAFHLGHYVADLHTLRDHFAREGKELLITAQGFPLVPPRYQSEVAAVVRGMSDDSTWGMFRDDIPLTTGRQMAVLAYAPGLQISTLSQWGYDSAILNNPIWHAPVGTTEPSRRTQYDRAFRGVLRPDGTYASAYAYGYNSNAGYAFTLNANDYAEWMRVQEKQSLLTPDGPLGAGVVIASGYRDDPNHAAFVGGGDSFGLPETMAGANAVGRLHDAGVSISFSASASTLDRWPPSNPPLILVNPAHLTAAEAAGVKTLMARGVPVVAFTGGDPALPPAVATALSGALLVPLDPAAFQPAQASAWAPKILAHVRQSITFPAGTAGYGFRSNGRAFVVLEDWREEGRTALLRYRPAAAGVTAVHAADASEHRPLAVQKDGDSYVISVPLRPGDAALVALEEEK